MLPINVSKLHKRAIRASLRSFHTRRSYSEHPGQGNLCALRALGARLTCQNCHVEPEKACHFHHLLLKMMRFSRFRHQAQGEP